MAGQGWQAGHSSAGMVGMGGGLGPHTGSVSSSLSLLPRYIPHVKIALSPSFTVYALLTIFILYLHYCMVLSLQYYCMALQLQYYTILLYNLFFFWKKVK